MNTLNLDTLTLLKGAHDDAEAGMCLLEAVSYVAGEPFSDNPKCTSPVLGAFGRALNDVLPDDKRQALRDYIPSMIGTAGDGLDEARSYLALDWLIRTHMPAFLALNETTREHATAVRALAPIVDMPTAERAGVVVRAARDAAEAGSAARAARAAEAGSAAAGSAAAGAAWAAAAAGSEAARAARAAEAAGSEAAWAARVAWAAEAGSAARDAARDFLAPTVAELQDSAVQLMGRMINPSSPTALEAPHG